ncbi:hypothetical protein [Nonomuraea jabiensis]|uniref:hypothetical protein n=1 Tax=Nonomuraea jabiensis TaxID=882448 RepID=UPI003D7366E6
MSENPLYTPVQLPPPLRILTEQEDLIAGETLEETADAHGVYRSDAREIVRAVLSTVGLFMRPPQRDFRGCSALKLAWNNGKYPDHKRLGEYFKCEKERGHGSTDHHNDDVADWSDGDPGSLPAAD